MQQPLRFKSCYHVEVVDPVTTLLFAETKHHLLQGAPYALVTPLIQKALYSADEIVDQLTSTMDALSIYYALEKLQQAGYLEEGDISITREMSAFCHQLGVPPLLAVQKLQSVRIYVENYGKISAIGLASILHSFGMQTVSTPTEATLCVLLVDDYMQKSLESFNEQAHRNKTPWLLIKPVGCEIWVGPFFEPGKTGCWKCLAFWLKKNRVDHAFVQHMKKSTDIFITSIAALPATIGLAFHFAALEIFKWTLRQDASANLGKMVSIDSLTGNFREHYLTKRTHCPCCGIEEPPHHLQPLLLSSRKKDKTHACAEHLYSPEYTLQKFAHHISPFLGVVHLEEPKKVHGLSHLHVCSGNHNFAISNSIRGIEEEGLRTSCSGKGKTAIQARAGCVCEGIERYNGVFQGNEPRILSSYKNLKNAIRLDECLLYSQNQYAKRDVINRNAHKFHVIPTPFSTEEEIEWSPVWSLTQETHKYVPTAFCYYGHPSFPIFCWADSNGNAAGHSLEEATLQGFFELVERDATAIWWYNRIQRPAVDIRSFQDSYLNALMQEYRELNRELWVLDLTHDFNIPVFGAFSRKLDGKKEEICLGFGAHFNPLIALVRAITEMNQLFAPYIENRKPYNCALLNDWMERATLENQPHLQCLPNEKSKKNSDYPTYQEEDILQDILKCKKLVEDRGMEMLLLDQTRPDIDLHVVKVIVPGMRHIWPRFAPGRLYEVPVQLGWLKQPLAESELNPLPLFI